MDKLPKPSLFVLSLIGALAVGSGPLMDSGREAAQAAVLGSPRGGVSLVAQAPAEPETTEGMAAALALSPDGQYMVRGTETGDLEWLDDQGRAAGQSVPQAHRGAVLGIVITSNGQTVISAGADGTLRRWDRQGNALGEPIAIQGSPLVALALSPDGQTLLGGRADGQVEQWAVATGTAQGSPIAAHAAAIQTLNYLAGGQSWMTGSQDGSLALWNADGSPAGQVASAHGGGVTQVVSSPDGQVIATTGGDGTLRFWDRVTFQPRGETLAAHTSPIRAATYSPDGSAVATAAADGTLRLWNVDGTSRWPEAVVLESEPRFVGFTPAGDLILGYADGRIERRGPQGALVVVTSAQPATEGAQPWDNLGPLQRLPQNTWWILAAVPALLILAGAVGALLGGRRSPESAEEEEPTTQDDPESETHLAEEPTAEPPRVEGLSGSVNPIADVPTESPALVDAVATPAPRESIVAPLPLDNGLPPEAELDWQDSSPAAAPVLETRAVAQAPATPLPPEADLLPVQESVPQPPTSKLEQARADLAGGRKCIRDGQYEAGLLCFNSAIEATEVERMKAEALGTPLGGINALATQAHTQRGHALGLMNQLGEAMESYNTALALDGAAVESWVGKGRLLIAQGRYEEALFCFDSALELDSSLGPAWAGKGQALLRLGRHAEGQTCHNRAVALGLESLGPLPPYPILDPATLAVPETAMPPVWPGGSVEIASPSDPTPDSTPEPDYDPDIPLDLQRVVMGLPSADTDLAYAFPSDYGVPPELEAEIAQMPSQAETIPPKVADWSTESPEPGLPPAPALGTAPWVSPGPPEAEADPSAAPSRGLDSSVTPLDDSTLDGNRQVDQLDLSVEANWNPAQGWPTPKATALDPSALAIPDPNPTVPDGPGDFVPPEEFTEDWPQDLPPEVIAAMASIPAGSPDAFEVVSPADPPALAPTAPLAQSWLRLSLDRSQGPRFYALWNIGDQDRLQARQAGGDILAVRLYDVTGHPTQTPLPPPVEEQRCHDDFAQDWYLAVPRWDRIYLAEVGYLSNAGQWQTVARSSEVSAISPQ